MPMIVKVPSFAKSLYPSLIWDLPVDGEKCLYLTFDDGPIPELTPWVLDVLEEYKVKATFFCVGDNVNKHAKIYSRILDEGHAVGNHTYNHVIGRKSNSSDYISNVESCAKVVESTLFRPPYGRMRYKQMKYLRNRFNVVMWDVLTFDFDKNTSPEQCLINAQKATNGSILVFHDNLKAADNLKYALPRFIEWALEKGYSFRAITL